MPRRTVIEVAPAATGPGRPPRVRLAGAQLGARRLPDRHGRVRVALVATEALLLAGDDVRVEVTVGPGLLLEIVETAGTVAYDMRGGSARWDVTARVADRGGLAWAGLPFVVSDGADVTRTTTVTLEGSARATLRETVVLGRTGEQGGRLDTRLSSTIDGRPLLAEATLVDPDSRRDPALLGGSRCLDSVTTLGHRLSGADTSADARDDTSHSSSHTDGSGPAPTTARPATLLQLHGEGSVARWLGDDAHASPLTRLSENATVAISGRNTPSLPLSLAPRP
ncbi:UreD urease accessory protein [Terracoccus luteus]|uniref:UreD urease accessory protein n=1 Tax=Terracoccus luteus TaxID=53356 RepID=A0A495XQA3_9MICO|nr:urease accessory protein UreD [Terracoccus luteus]RKT76771.1 UreD urease accessory protein [Terracoccus luteus]